MGTRRRKTLAIVAGLALLSGGVGALFHARLQTQHEYELAYLSQLVAIEPCDKASLRELLASAKSEAELDEMKPVLERSSALCPYERAVLFATLQPRDGD